MQFNYPTKKDLKIIETGQMREMINRTLSIHGNLVVWTGRSRVGKTTTALTFAEDANRRYEEGIAGAFRVRHFQVGRISNTDTAQKQGIKSIYEFCIGNLEASVYRSRTTASLAALTVEALRDEKIEVILIDEAGDLPLDAIRGMISVGDLAKKEKWDLTLVLIGMDDLPTKMQRLPQIKGRVNEWCYFEPYELEETFDLIRQLEPAFANYSLDNKEQSKQIKFIHEQFQGTIG